jgi:predicted transglutaminase-like cysteine proteinase
MYSSVKALALATAIVVVSIQPGADAARAPYSVESEQPIARLSSAMFSPFADGLAGKFQQRDVALTDLPNSFESQPPVAMISPASTEPVSLPKYPMIERLDAVAPAQEQVKPEAEVALPAQPVAPPAAEAPAPKPPVASIPAPSPREAIVIPQTPAPLAQPKDVAPSRRAARPAPPRTDFIAFDGVAGAPFAHTRFCLKYPGECRVQKQKLKFRGGPIELTAARRLELVRINADVNRSIVGTRMNEPVAQEQWVISPKLGDCNDYAVTKRHKLIASGWPARALLLAEVVTPSGEHHLVLVVRTRQGDIVADNLNANLNNWTRTPYQWVRIESPVNPLYWAKLKAPQPDVVAMNASGHRL